MDSINYLLLIFITVTLLHLLFVVRLSVKLSIPWLLPESNNINYPRFNPSSDRLRSLLSIVALFSPLLIFKGYRGLLIENNTFDITFLILLISLTSFLLYYNRNKIWSKNFRAVKNPKQLMSAINVEILQTVNRMDETIFQNSEKINSIQNDNNEMISQFIHLENKTTEIESVTQNHKMEFIKTETGIFNMENAIQELKKQNVGQLKSKQPENKKEFKSFFKKECQYYDVIKLLNDNGFHKETHKHTAKYLCVLIVKLIDLNLIQINRNNNHFCEAISKHFKIIPFHASNLSPALKEYNDKKHFNETRKPIFNSFKYLDSIV